MLRFIDLFAGIGGFHVALKNLGHDCVMASEINNTLIDLYKQNFPNTPILGDVRKIEPTKIPDFDILCAGFPCQPFSKAGKQKGIKEDRGKAFYSIVDILKEKKPKYFILENVPQLARHDNQNTWQVMKEELTTLHYDVDIKQYSPHEFGIPQHRKRVYIVGKKGKKSLESFAWIDEKRTNTTTDIKSILEENIENSKKLDPKQIKCIDVWQEFLEILDPDEPIGFPIWSFEFGATYPYQKVTPYSSTNIGKYKGSFGKSLYKENYSSLKLPSYVRLEQEQFPKWKQGYIKSNRNLYNKYQEKLDKLIPKIENLEIPSWQKFEWNCQDDERIIKDHILQFRASGLRVKKTNFTPSLVCTSTQVPIIGWENRYITKQEGLRLQSFQDTFILPENSTTAFKALGNAVNAHIVQLIAEALLLEECDKNNEPKEININKPIIQNSKKQYEIA